VALCVGFASAGDISNEWAGVYQRSFENGLVTGERYESTDTLEIVRLDAQSAYVELSLHFYNGHECSFSGLFQVEGESLVFREPNPPPDREQCALTITRADGQMALGDANGACRIGTCGARGGYDGASLPISSRRQMTSAEIDRKTPQITEALRESGRASAHH
jgi:hypothetical protein